MPLAAATRLGVYEIVAPLGSGGMGEVYRARDTRLNRQVAIKILPDVLTLDAQHLARFEREAQVLGSLNHPNVAQIYGLEESGGVRALVMELVEGHDLSELLRERPIPLDGALPIALQITQGLEAAHEHGIIHRDLKPANIKVRDDGTVKLLDFGLAKGVDAAAGSGHALDNSPTITSPAAMTRDGVILGTAAYMAPEQARGKAVDKRADIWAFGAVLYEMLAGRRAFDGETVTDVLASVVKSEPDWSALPSDTPFLVKRLLRHCLDKDPRQRLGDIRDARIEIAEAIASPFADVSSSPAGTTPARSWLAWSVAIMAALVAVGFAAALATGVLQFRSEPPARGVIRFTIASPEGLALVGSPTVSPDGRRIAFRANQGGRLQLFVRSLDALSAKPLAAVPLTPAPSTLFWSPDSRRVAFVTEAKLKTIEVDSGLVSIISDANDARGGTWNAADEIVFAPGASGPLYRVSAAGGVPAQVTELAAGHGGHRYPTFLPNGRDFIFLSATTSGPQVLRGSLDSRSVEELVASDTRSGFVPPDLMLFVRAGTLFAQNLDISTMALRGDRVAVAQVGVNLGQTEAQFSASPDVLLYREAAVSPNIRLAWVDRKGRVEMVPLPPAAYGDPNLSPDGRQLALTKREGGIEQIWMYDLQRGTLGKRTFEENNSFPIWSRDGQLLTFTRGLGLAGPLVRIRADGTGQAEPLVANTAAAVTVATSWSPDGRLLVFQSGQNVMMRDAHGTVTPLLETAAYEREGRFAPDGRWFAYRSDETGRDEVYVQSFPPGNGKWQISTEGGAQPMWAPDGTELFYKNGNKLMKVDVELGGAFRASTPRLLFEILLPEKTPGDPSRYAVSPDGQRFLVTTTDPSQPPSPDPPIQVVLNWREMLSARAIQR